MIAMLKAGCTEHVYQLSFPDVTKKRQKTGPMRGEASDLKLVKVASSQQIKMITLLKTES
jgi:hypothetical protein